MRMFSHAVCLALAASSWAYAGTATSNMSASSTVENVCTISAGALAFGTYDPIVTHASTPLDATATLTVTCTNAAATTVKLGQGSNPDTGSTDATPLRRLRRAATSDYLAYFLYQDSGRTTVWGNDTSSDKDNTGTGSSQSLTVYGRVSAGQNTIQAGSYSDTVVATITF